MGTTHSAACASRYTGKERDAESGLDYFGARYYGSNMGRWMSPDWSAQPEPVPYSKLGYPQSFNLYAYILNNPLRGTDPDGHTLLGLGPSGCAGNESTGASSSGCGPQESNSYKQAAQQNGTQDKRDALAAAELDQAKKKSTAWSDTAPPCAGPKCNLFVAAMLKAVGIGQKKAPLAGDWATPGKTPKGWEMLPLGAAPAPGDIAAYAHSGWSDATGHVGIVTAIDSRGIQVVATSGIHVYSTHDFNADQPNDGVRYSRYIGVPWEIPMLRQSIHLFVTIIMLVTPISSARYCFSQQTKARAQTQNANLSDCEKPVIYRIELSPEGKVKYKLGQSSQSSLSLGEFAKPFAACSESRKLIILLIGSVPVDAMFNLLDAAKKENLANVQVIAQDVQGKGAIEIHVGSRVPPVK